MEVCCFTGHRLLPGGAEGQRLRYLCESSVRQAYAEGCRRFFSGGALGFDMLAAAIVCYLRDSFYADMSLHLLLPCRDQAVGWSEKNRQRYADMLSLADSYVFLHESYSERVMQSRNAALVEKADLFIAYMKNPASGTGSTLSMARRAGIPVRNLAEK